MVAEIRVIKVGRLKRRNVRILERSVTYIFSWKRVRPDSNSEKKTADSVSVH